MLFLKTFKDAKFVVDGNAFQTFITLSTKNFCLMLAVYLAVHHKQFMLMTPSVSVTTQCKEIIEIYIY